MARRPSHDQANYVISVAAELAGVHPQTLRVYERKGLVQPRRTQGNSRRYSEQDIDLLRRIQELTEEGVNLAGVTRILELEHDLQRAKDRYQRALQQLQATQQQLQAVSVRASIVPLRDVRRIRRAMKSDALDSAGKPKVFIAPPVPPADH
ncbi:MAG: MerR family transcriptional regulator, heat shock protein HspR [Actinomycetota bacterium]|jgi:MerR family transcriptional regulator/heat shock protein HspR|nr:MerR family transcriptional regulator, heat shock protein HspR [Actinomycetota bacterium]